MSQPKDIHEAVLPKVMQTVRAASALAAQDVNFYKSVDADLAQKIDTSARGVLDIANKLIRNVGPTEETSSSIRFGIDNISSESDWKPIANVLDSIFENIDSAFDQAIRAKNGRKDDNSNSKNLQYLEDGNDVNSKHSGKRITKPQLSFRVPVDNSESHPFKPKLTCKPNGLKSFEESVELKSPEPNYENSIEIVDPAFYPQPYEYEIDTQPYPASILEKSEPIAPQDWTSTTATWVDTVEELQKMVEELKKSSEIAVDLEHHDYRSYYGIVCLMQISNRDQDWIIDTLALRDDLECLNTVFTNPHIVKVFHGAFMDIIWLQRDLGLYIVSLFDTYHASKSLGFPKFSLAYLLETFAHFKTSKKYQLADWRIRPLSPPMMAYARSDTHFLLSIFDQLKNKLIDAGNEKLQRVLFDSRQVAKRRFEYTPFRPLTNNINSRVSCPVMASNPREPFSSIMVQYNVPSHKKSVVEALYNWRDRIAKIEDESVRFVMPNQLLVNLANLNQPVDVAKVLGASHFVSEHVRLNAKEVAELLENTLKLASDNDWDLVDKWNDAQNGRSVAEVDYSNIDEDVAEQTGESFDLLCQSLDVLLGNSTSTSLVSKSTRLFSNIYDNSAQQTLEIDPEKSVVVKHDFGSEYNSRLVEVWNGLQELERSQSMTVSTEVAEEADEEQEIAEESQPAVEIQPIQPVISFKEDKLDPNEIVTIRKKKHGVQQKKNPQTTLKQLEGPVLDFATSNKVMLDTGKDRYNKKKENQKKRSFDPYSKESEGPKPAKKTRKLNEGKSSTFRNTRRG
ncbi:ribosomal RNA processing 3'-5' exonuclease [Scheffersomyces stipitis CBS 6054]|uniref:Ribosomal RNA processing 3'-5' exonuclease n=1 Tax=Scheffersomyces stipitis (strain ATCC 58785 / CBS 6054 / NBRC 10063 / NRRL Y-11545) TaxID=322104 RepID=A3GG05_PICST|nr:exosome component 3'-5' exonuclease [Scheffersomyces stipitis CBS 6054]EAZ63852.2 ribosomal RNA processing 3'-5' exonuclease [Scheffersomyces stipitis CBS 6054]